MVILKKFYENLKQYPDKKILKAGNISYTFKEVEGYSNYIAYMIDKSTRKQVIPIYIRNDIHVLPVVLGILKSGKTVLPLTTALDLEKTVERISDVEFDIVISDAEESSMIKLHFEILKLDIEQVNFSTNYKVSKKSEENYIICTSGTTGIPKKVVITEKNIVWLLEQFYKLVNFNEHSIFLFTTPYTFDVSITEIFAPVFTAGTLICFDSEWSDIERIKNINKMINKSSVTHMSVSPSYVDFLCEKLGVEALYGLKYICLGGENFPLSLGRKLQPLLNKGCKIFNLYGPSETTIYATYYELTGRESVDVPIGFPFPGAEVLLLDHDKENTSGEVYIGGCGVTKGYLNNEVEASSKFLNINGRKFYRTGDYAHFNSDKQLVFDHRKDDQVQVNGIRIELDEIATLVSKIDGVVSCRTAYKDKRIYIFYKSTADLKETIKTSIPKYVNPIIIKVPEFLFNQNRKLDSKKMIENYYLFNTRKEVNVSKGNRKAAVLDILEKFGVKDIADLDSLDTIRFFLEIDDVFGIEIPDADIIDLLNIDKLVKYIVNYSENISEAFVDVDDSEVMLKNLELAVLNNYDNSDFEEEKIDTLLHQKNYEMSSYNSILSFELKFLNNDINSIMSLKSKVKSLSQKIDILRFVLVKKDTLYFKKIKFEKVNPIIMVCDRFISDSKIGELLYHRYGTPLFIVLVSLRKNSVKFYFTHHVVDKYSINLLEKIVNDIINNDKDLSEINYSSYEKYINFIKKSTNQQNWKNLLDFIPTAERKLEIKKLPNHQLRVFKLRSSAKSTQEITDLSIFAICQCIFDNNNIDRLTGYFIGNTRMFQNLDATQIIGDLHTSIDFEISRNDSLSDLKCNIAQRVEKFENGIHIYDYIFDGYPEFNGVRGDALKKAATRNLTFNYLGEIKNVDSFIEELKLANYAEKYFIIFTNKDTIYIVNSSNLLEVKDYNCNNFKITSELC